MKIAIVCPNDFTVVCFCGELVRALQNGVHNKIFVISDVHDGYESGYYTEIMKSWGIEHIHVDFYRFTSPFRDLRYIFDLKRILSDNKMDMIVNISTKANVYGPIAGRLAGVKNIVCSVWGMGVAFAEGKSLRGMILRLSIRTLYRIAGKLSSKIWFTNELDHQYFIDNKMVDDNKAILTEFFVNTEDFSVETVKSQDLSDLRAELNLGDRDSVVVLVARMSWAKGIGEFVKAAEILRSDLPDLKFLLVGPEDIGSSDRVPTAFLRACEESGNIQWLGFRRDVKELYALCDLAVYPSYYREGGYPKGLTEPMSMGKPIITTDNPHCSKTVDDGKNGFIVPVRDASALANAIKEVITNPERAREFGSNSRSKAVNEFDERKIVGKLVREIMPEGVGA